MTLRCPNNLCGKPLQRTADGGLPASCPACGAALKVRRRQADDSGGKIGRTAIADASADDAGLAQDSILASDFASTLTPLTARTSLRSRSPSRNWILPTSLIVGVLAAAGGWLWLARPTGNSTPNETTASVRLQNAARNYELAPPAGNWVRTEPPKDISAELAFRNDAENAWMFMSSYDSDADDSSAIALAEDLRRWLVHGMQKVDAFEASADRLDRLAAQRARIEGELDGQPVVRIGLTASAHGIGYRLALWTNKTYAKIAANDFGAFAAGFRLLSDQPPHKTAARIPSNLAEFRSVKFGYLLRAPRNIWRENPDLQVSSRFADLKLVDRSRNAHVVVSPRQTANLTAFADAYIARVQREFDSTSVQVLRIDRQAKVSGHEAQRVLLNVNDATGPFQLGCTMVERQGWIYQIECRAPTEKWSSFEPAFDNIVSSFEVFERPAAETTAKAEPTEAEMKRVEKTASASASTTEERDPPAPAEKPLAKPEKTETAKRPNAASKKADEKTAEKAKSSKRKSLDDLD